MKKIIFSALALASVTLAGAQTVRNLVVTDKDGVTHEFAADQIDGVIFQEAPQYISLEKLLVARYEESGNSGMYHIEFGTGEPDADGQPKNIGDIQVALLMQAPKSENLSEPVLPDGYYRVGNSTSDFTFDVTRSAVYVRAEEGPEGVAPAMIMNGTVDVRAGEDGNYTIDMEFVTTGGEIYLSYSGTVPFEAGYSEYQPFTEPVNVDFANGQGRFWGNWYYPYSADLMAMFSAGEIVDGVMKDGYILSIYFCEPKPEDCMAPGQRVADGTYSVESRNIAASSYLPFRFTPGAYVDFLGEPVLSGSRLEHISSDGQRRLGLITGGTFTVSENGTKFDFDLTTAEGVAVTGSYTGVPMIGNYCDNDVREPQRPYSTLTEDVPLEWADGTIALSYNMGQSVLEDANTLTVMITEPSMEKGDFIMFDLLSNDGILTEGTYTVDRVLEPGHIFPGTVDFAQSMIFAWYGDLDSTVTENGETYQTDLGPIESGTVTVTDLGNNRVKIVFDVMDDNGHSITGEYSGELIDASAIPTQAARYAKGAKRLLRSSAKSARK